MSIHTARVYEGELTVSERNYISTFIHLAAAATIVTTLLMYEGYYRCSSSIITFKHKNKLEIAAS